MGLVGASTTDTTASYRRPGATEQWRGCTHVEWPDFGVPADIDSFRAALADALERARRGEIVELGCLGGHGRTGTALACLATLTGTPPNEAVEWVRANYCEKAVETDEQLRLVTDFSA
jgi:protein-tyrosine phosphatase